MICFRLPATLLFLVLVATTFANSAATTRSIRANDHQHENSLCDRLHPEDLPKECLCKDAGNLHVMVYCIKPFNSTYFNDTIGMKLDLDICNAAGSSITLDVTERNHNIDFPISAVRAGEEENIPIPGLSIIVPGLGSLGVDATVLIAGNPDFLTLQVGLNACLSTHHKEICASSIPGLSNVLPWYVLKGTYSFGDVCGTSGFAEASAADSSAVQ